MHYSKLYQREAHITQTQFMHLFIAKYPRCSFYQVTDAFSGSILQLPLAPETSKDARYRRFHVRAYSDGHDNIVGSANSPG
jgi:hypothetical protein